MSVVTYTQLRFSRGFNILLVLSAIGVVAIAYRFIVGLGAVTNLSDGYPWGFLTGVNKLTQIALAAGGFVMAGIIHIFGGHRFHRVARSAILAALLGYILFISALIVDLGRPWNLYWALVSWNHYSPMFEVAWCVLLYSFVLSIEFLPVVFERFRLRRAIELFHAWVPILIVMILTLFTFVMTGSRMWTIAVFGLLAIWEILMRWEILPRDKQMPLLLIAAGIMFSTLHQSTLGSLFLIVDRLSPLWYSPFLPVIFFASAVAAGPSMVILERLLTTKIRRRPVEMDLVVPLARAMPYVIATYIFIRVADLVVRNAVFETVSISQESIWFWLEMWMLIISMALYANLDALPRKASLLLAASASVLAVVVHRVGVTMIGMSVPEYPPYVPLWLEVVIGIGLLALGLLAYRLIVHFFPVYEEGTHQELSDKDTVETVLATTRS